MGEPVPLPLKLIAFYGSPRREGNTARLLRQAVKGARQGGAAVEEIFLREQDLSPCLEEDGCRNTGRCVIGDDFQKLYGLLEDCDGILLASPLFFGTVSAHAKILIDRCQCFWVRKYLLGRGKGALPAKRRLGVFISCAARRERADQFEGATRTVRYFFAALDVVLWKSLVFPGLEEKDDVLAHPEYLQEAHAVGAGLVAALCENPSAKR